MLEKLIRDRIPEIAANRGQTMQTRQADDREMPAFLAAKLIEEAREAAATTDPAELLDELGDVYEVLLALAARHGHTLDDVKAAARLKATERGQFTARLVWTIPPAA